MTTAKGEATKARILDAAADLLVAGGPEHLSLDEVMRRTAPRKGQLVHYFPGGKDELRQAATERQVQRLTELADSAELATWDDWERWFGQIIQRHEQQSRDDACEVAALAARALDTNPRARSLIGHAFTQWDGLLQDRLRTMQHTGHLRPDAPIAQLASLTLAALEGGAVIDKATGSTHHLRHALEQALILLRGHAPASLGHSRP
jgi:TetR/AcrR family transcriptional regulator, transcriptional repressor for nem operon